jgi:quercetin dioxygenase-like cupin family protein
MTDNALSQISDHKPDRRKIAYQKPQPYGVLNELLIHGALDEAPDERLWVPQAEGVDFRPLLMNVSQGYFVNILRVRKAGVLSRHRHAGPVHAFTLKGRWQYLEHDWVANAGDYAFEPPGEVHTLIVPEDVQEMRTLFHVTGGYTYVDPYGEALAYEDVFTKIEAMRAHFDGVGLGASYADRFIK